MTLSLSLPDDIIQRARRVRLLGLDVDGVLTPGGIWLGETENLRRFDSRDGVGIKLLQKAGVAVAVISGKSARGVARRCAELRIEDVYQGTVEKIPAMRELLAKHGLAPEQAAFVGDDLPDMPLLLNLGLGLAVADACAEVREAADWTLANRGGRGAVREAAELILKAQGRWEGFVDDFRSQTLD